MATFRNRERINMKSTIRWRALLLMAASLPGLAQACACGCGIFDVSTAAMFPTGGGMTMFLEQDFMDQDRNWSGTSSAPAADNSDKSIRTNFWTLGGQYMFNRVWSVQAELPYWQRHFVTTTDSGVAGFSHGALGDVRLRGAYTGFSDDLSTGITFGVKLPSGDSRYANFDPDTEIGTGSTDLLLGAYHLGRLTADNRWTWFSSAQWGQPVMHKDSYRPGAELNGVFGVYHAGWRSANGWHVAPLLQLGASWRGHDGGTLGHPDDSGYSRVFLTPGVQVDAGKVRLYADVARSLYTNASGNQLMASTLFKLSVSVHF
jgi:hypothetical protein